MCLSEEIASLKEYHSSINYSDSVTQENIDKSINILFDLKSKSRDYTFSSYIQYLLMRQFLISAQQFHPLFESVKKEYIATFLNNEIKDLEVTEYNKEEFIKQTFYLPYVLDYPARIKKQQAILNNTFLNYIKENNEKLPEKETRLPNKKIKVGYLSEAFRNHSVGWLIRWLIQNHDTDTFEIHLYHYCAIKTPLTIKEYAYLDNIVFHHLDPQDYTTFEVAKIISSHDLDILVELESVTTSKCFEVCSFKPAPVIISFLGWDSPSNPFVDYYITDRIASPDPNIYTEKLLYTPNNYIAISGFEIGCKVPEVIKKYSQNVKYLTTCTPQKRNLRMVETYFDILNAVPDSVLFVKSLVGEELHKNFWKKACEYFDFDESRIVVLPLTSSEIDHRAILNHVDIILDSYPYSGATTSLEALWCNLPIVTLVGDSFQSRNTATFLYRLDLQDLISCTHKGYKTIAIMLGESEDWRNSIRQKLHDSKTKSSFWDIKTYTQNIEEIYKGLIK
jgi:predicted O-linked N-acetylglucosamine transferase (SPINDLY family)